MSRIRLVVSDVDGTLVTRDKALRPATVAAVRRLHQAGVAFSVCSSRPPFGLRMLIEPLALALPFGGYNAGAIVEPDLTVIEERTIPPSAARQAVDLFRARGIECWVFAGNQWFVTDPNGPHVEHETRTVQTPPTVAPEFEGHHLAAVGKIVGPSDDHELVAAVADEMRRALGSAANVSRSQAYYCDVIPPGVDKGRIVELLAGRLGLARDEIAVLGDMENDLQMFAKAGFGIAMGNASPAVKQAAQGVTGSNDEDGWAEAIDRYVLR